MNVYPAFDGLKLPHSKISILWRRICQMHNFYYLLLCSDIIAHFLWKGILSHREVMFLSRIRTSNCAGEKIRQNWTLTIIHLKYKNNNCQKRRRLYCSHQLVTNGMANALAVMPFTHQKRSHSFCADRESVIFNTSCPSDSQSVNVYKGLSITQLIDMLWFGGKDYIDGWCLSITMSILLILNDGKGKRDGFQVSLKKYPALFMVGPYSVLAYEYTKQPHSWEQVLRKRAPHPGEKNNLASKE